MAVVSVFRQEVRMRCMKVVALVGTLCFASGATAVAQVPAVEASKIRTEVEAAVAAVVAGANAVDVERTFASCSTSGEFRMADNGAIYASREATLAAFRAGFGPLRSQDIRILEHQVSVLSRDLAMYTSLGTFTTTDKSGQASPARKFAWTALWRREGTQWRMLNVHQSFAPVAAP